MDYRLRSPPRHRKPRICSWTGEREKFARKSRFPRIAPRNRHHCGVQRRAIQPKIFRIGKFWAGSRFSISLNCFRSRSPEERSRGETEREREAVPAPTARSRGPGRPWTTARLTTQPRVDPEIPCRSGRNPGPEGKSGPKVLKTPRWSAVRRNRSSKDRCVLGFEHATRNHAPLRRSASSFARKEMGRAKGKLRRNSAARTKTLGCLTIGSGCRASAGVISAP